MISVLSIGGLDPCGYAGLVADYRTFHSFAVRGNLVTTVVTAQNKRRFLSCHQIPKDRVQDQLSAVFEDQNIRACKTGLMPAPRTVALVAEHLSRKGLPIVVDPVFQSTTGETFSSTTLIQAYKKYLLPLATMVTPNRMEASLLIGKEVTDLEQGRSAVREISALGPRVVLLKGGHFAGEPQDIFWDGTELTYLGGPRLEGTQWRGLGCTLSAALTALLARGYEPLQAVRLAKKYLLSLMRRSLDNRTAPYLNNPFEIDR